MKKRKRCTPELNAQLKQQMLRQIAVNQGDPWSVSLHMHSDSTSLFLLLYQSQRSMENLRLNRTSASNHVTVDFQQGCFVPYCLRQEKKPSDPFVVQITPERALNGVLPWLCNSRHVKTVSDRSENAAMLPADQTAGQIERKRSVGTLAHPSLRSGSEGNPG
ncbi:hypothetical protein DPX16_6875 [Anabarilius grahami]|uniref:Uncharacterized protein n=1 Tax=Anabarilius grahami TaxID=495550 RepID=A0A3N0Y5P0_ANAGA|nr:hypothetical protein DPX16_6875 [Anabarilius grahami]